MYHLSDEKTEERNSKANGNEQKQTTQYGRWGGELVKACNFKFLNTIFDYVDDYWVLLQSDSKSRCTISFVLLKGIC